jgi:hypothetical protein
MMRYLVGFMLATALLASPLRVSAQETSAPKPYFELELDSSVLEMTRRGRGIGGIDPSLAVRGEWLPKAEVMASNDQRKLAFLIPRHLQKRVPGGSAEAEFGLEYKEPEPSQEELKRRRRLGLGIGLGVGLPLVGMAIGVGVWAANFSFE